MKASRFSRDPSAARVRILTLGRFDVTVAGQALSARQYGQRKPLALLKVLIAAGPPGAPVDKLTDILWPDLEGDRAGKAFAVALHRLRRMIGAGALPLRDSTMMLDPGSCWVDAWEFDRVESEAGVTVQAGLDAGIAKVLGQRLLELYRGPFLEGAFESPDILSCRSGLHHRFLSTVRGLGALLCDRGAAEDVVAMYRRALAVDNLAEELYLALIDCHIRNGQRADALRIFRQCADVMQAALGSGPSVALQSRLAAIQAVPEPTAPPPSALAGAGPATEPAQREAGTVATLPLPRPNAGHHGEERPPMWTRRRLLGAAGIVAVAALPAGTIPWLVDRAGWGDQFAEALLERDGLPRYRPAPLAVVPYDAPTDGPQQRLLSREVSERITAALTKFPHLDLPLHNVREATRDAGVLAREFGSKIGAAHLLEVHVQQPREQLTADTRLVEMASGQVIWSRHFSLSPKSMPEGLDRLVSQVSRNVVARLAYGNRRFLSNPVFADDPASWEALVTAQLDPLVSPRAGYLTASRIYERLLERYPDTLAVMMPLASAQVELARHVWVADTEAAWKRALALAERADKLAPGDARGGAVQAYYASYHSDHWEAARLIERFIAVNNQDPMSYRAYAEILLFAGRTGESLAAIKEAARRMPSYPAHLFTILELGYYLQGRYNLASAAATVALSRVGERTRSLAALAVSQVARGNLAPAREAMQKLLRIEPWLKATGYARWVFRPFKDKGAQPVFEQHLIEAGMPA